MVSNLYFSTNFRLRVAVDVKYKTENLSGFVKRILNRTVEGGIKNYMEALVAAIGEKLDHYQSMDLNHDPGSISESRVKTKDNSGLTGETNRIDRIVDQQGTTSSSASDIERKIITKLLRTEIGPSATDLILRTSYPNDVTTVEQSWQTKGAENHSGKIQTTSSVFIDGKSATTDFYFSTTSDKLFLFLFLAAALVFRLAFF